MFIIILVYILFIVYIFYPLFYQERPTEIKKPFSKGVLANRQKNLKIKLLTVTGQNWTTNLLLTAYVSSTIRLSGLSQINIMSKTLNQPFQ